MTTPLALLAFALVMSSLGHRLLRSSRWPERAPRLGIIAWLMLMASAIVSVIMAGTMAAIPHLSPTHNLSHSFSDLIVACAHAFHEHYTDHTSAALGALGAAAAITVASRAAWGVISVARASRELVAQQHRHLSLVSRRGKVNGALVVEHHTPTVYCTPGRRKEIVVTTAALDALEQEHLDAVLAHERAHLTSRHHLVVIVATGLRKAFPRVPLFATAQNALQRLVEMDADDAAVKYAGRKTLASALLRLADGGTPAAALGAGGPLAVDRVRRLAEPSHPLGRSPALLAGLMSALIILTPAAFLATPMALTVLVHCGLALA